MLSTDFDEENIRDEIKKSQDRHDKIAKPVKREDLTKTTIHRQLAKDFYYEQPYFFDEYKNWWLWKKNQWKMVDDIDIMIEFDRYFVLDTERGAIKSTILEALRKHGRSNKPKEIPATWVQYKSKIYDIKTGETFEATPAFFVCNPIDWEVGESEDTPILDKYINAWVSPEDVDRLYEILAFITVPKYFIHSFFSLHAPPGYGKSTFTNLLIKFIGESNHVTTSIAKINSNPRFETKNWHKKLLITMSEVNNVNELTNSAIINNATGEDPIGIEFKGSNTTSDFVNYGKFVYPANKLLKIDPDDGFGRRVRTVSFINRFEKEKDILNEIPDVEFSNLAKKCIRIAGELWETRRFTGDLSISERMNHYQEVSKTPLEKFIQEHCDETDASSRIPLAELFVQFNKYQKEKKAGIISRVKLGKELRKLGYNMKNDNWESGQFSFDNSKRWESKMTVFGLKKKVN